MGRTVFNKWLKEWNKAHRELHNKKLTEGNWDRLFNIAANAEQQGYYTKHTNLKKVM